MNNRPDKPDTTKPDAAQDASKTKKHPYPLRSWIYDDGWSFSLRESGLMFARDDFDYTGAAYAKQKKNKSAEETWSVPDELPKFPKK